MSRFFRPELTLALYGNTAVVQSARLLGRKQPHVRTLTATTPMERLLEALAALPAATSARLQLFLPSSQFVFWQVPWVAADIGEADMHALAARTVEHELAVPGQELLFTLSPARYGKARLACGLSRSTVAAIQEQLPTAFALAGLYPLLSLAWPTLSRAGTPQLYSEPGFAALYLPDSVRLHGRRLPGDNLASAEIVAELAGLFGIEAPPPLYLATALGLASGAPQARQLNLHQLLGAA